jgi:Na+/phosphate symporter
MSRELTDKIKQHLGQRVQNNELDNSEVIEIINLLGTFLNAETISDYAKRENITYNGALKRNLKSFQLFGVKFVIEND